MSEAQSDTCSVPPASAKLIIHLFGSIAIEAGGRALPGLRSRKGRWLLAILALRSGRDVDREWLAGTLWPDDQLAAARRSLRQTLFDLRSALDSEAWRLAAESPGALRLNLEGAWVDALVFDALVARGDVDSLDAAVRMYRGPLLEDCPVEWALEARRTR